MAGFDDTLLKTIAKLVEEEKREKKKKEDFRLIKEKNCTIIPDGKENHFPKKRNRIKQR